MPDLLRFSAEILSALATREGRLKDRRHESSLFDANTVEIFSARQGPADSSRALGWDTPSTPSSSGSLFAPRSIGHLGYTGTSLWMDRDRQLAVVLLTNRTWPDRQNKAIQSVRPAFHDAVGSSV